MRTFTLLAALTTQILAAKLFVSSYAGDITTLDLTEENGRYNLSHISTASECGPNPSWLTIDANRGLLFCLNEGLETPNGSLSSFTIRRDGSLDHVQNTTTLPGPVSGVIYGDSCQRGIALAHYAGSAVSTWRLQGAGHFKADESFTFTLQTPGAVPDRQASPHEHEAIVDPTGQYLLVPDLGADLVRVFAINTTNLALEAQTPLSVSPGTGPRHAVFYTPYTGGSTTFLYVVGELSADVTAYSVEYIANQGGLNFTKVFRSDTLGFLNHDRINAPAEIAISPDNRFLIISNRNSTLFTLPGSENGTAVPSDSLSTFKLQHDGTLQFVQLWPSSGLYPRQFSLDRTGSLVAVGNQLTGNVVILARDISTGLIGDPIATTSIAGNVTCVVWDQ